MEPYVNIIVPNFYGKQVKISKVAMSVMKNEKGLREYVVLGYDREIRSLLYHGYDKEECKRLHDEIQEQLITAQEIELAKEARAI